ncbi:hypothetical protein ACQCN2_16430 [Brevibacillus ginsengisoli]|uniref:hypothetical protein n=1 Tax=Brevibacillus ginsengisoli TaxID=363854 RepID=UPI003CF6BB91
MMKMKLGVWQFAALFAMALLGTTHLTGYEWLRFFTYFGSWGTVGLIFAGLSMTWICYKLAKIMDQHEVDSISELFQKVLGPIISPTFRFLFYAISFGYIGYLFSSEAARLSQWFPWSGVFNALLIGIFVGLLLQLKVHRLIGLVASCLIMCAVYFSLMLLKQQHIEIPSFAYQFNSWWLFRTFLFISAHLLLSLIIFLPAARLVPTTSERVKGIWLGGGIFTIVALLCHAILLTYWHDVHSSTQPLILISSQLFTGSHILYHMLSFIYSLLYIGIWTLFLTNMLSERFDLRHNPIRYLVLLLLICLSVLYIVLPWIGTITLLAGAYVGGVFLVFVFWKLKR